MRVRDAPGINKANVLTAHKVSRMREMNRGVLSQPATQCISKPPSSVREKKKWLFASIKTGGKEALTTRQMYHTMFKEVQEQLEVIFGHFNQIPLLGLGKKHTHAHTVQ